MPLLNIFICTELIHYKPKATNIMKKYIYTAVLGCLMSLPAMAQKGVAFGVQAGENVTGMVDNLHYGDVNYLYRPTLGFTYGLSGSVNFNDYFGMQAEINRAQMGENLMLRSDNSVRESLDMSYTQIPVMIKIMGGDYKSRFTMMAGPQWSILNSATVTRNTDKYGAQGTSNVKSDFAHSDFGMVLTAGTEFAVYKNVYMDLHARFQYGFRSVNKTENVLYNQPGESEQLHNLAGGLFASLHYLIRYNTETTAQ
jgi:opacity protein-like surface antigen